MAASVVPALLRALTTTAQGLLGVNTAYPGPGLSDSPGDYLFIGAQDPDVEQGATEAVSVTQEQMAFGATRPRQEEGVVRMCARSVNGDSDLLAAVDAVYALQESLATALRTTNDLGVTGTVQLGNGANLRLEVDFNEFGAVATLFYDIAFEAAI
jgi:hypothetical protein